MTRLRSLAVTVATPIVVITGCPESQRDDILASGADRFLAKPVMPETLLETIESL